MDIVVVLKAALLGIVEGLTEFLPISSTGHLIIMDNVLGFEGPSGKVFEISIQLGAILAICWLFRSKLIHITTHITTSKTDQQFTLNILCAFLPAAILGFLFHHAITEHLFNVTVVASMMVIGGFVILLIEKYKPAPTILSLEAITPKKSLLVGLCQALAMIPGVSRSGATIMGSLVFGIERKIAAEFSFFLAIPTMFAATLYDVYKHRADLTSDGIILIAVGFIAAFISALMVVKWLMAFISKHGFGIFAWYRIIVGSIVLTLIAVKG